ncbi:hypothetical protein GCM10010277_73870 [Streptomyces longisporoflavus]|uniref:UbiA family prenyltransferase n=1 Tax=Streptomyces longisporoflavus TaxID=28044 RepID=UPI00167DFA4D|nr:UbiA family prenyltransferase [Streptomyces longisporoflavus]GGV66192.1 hypothetical protein GCM10010277_73870 [Streptomyces longisporoflavus]
MTAAFRWAAAEGRSAHLSGHVETLRPYDLVAVVMVAVAGAVLAEPQAHPVRAGLAAVAAVSACAGALYAADHLTRHDDILTKPHRPIPSGRLTGTTARRCAAAGAVSAVAVTWAVNWHGLFFIAAAALAQTAYARWLKDRGLWGDLAVGLSGWTCAMLTAATFTAPWPSAALWPAALALGLQGTFSNTLLALGDTGTDRAAGCRTLPVRNGPGRTLVIMTGCATACYTLTGLVPTALGRPASPAFLGLSLTGAILATACLTLARTASRLPRATELHLYERLALPAALLTLADHTLSALTLTTASAAILALTPRTMLHHPANPGPQQELHSAQVQEGTSAGG